MWLGRKNLAQRTFRAARGLLLRMFDAPIGPGLKGYLRLRFLIVLHPYCDRGLEQQVLAAKTLIFHKIGASAKAFLSGTGCLIVPTEKQIIQVPLSRIAIDNLRQAFAVRASILRHSGHSVCLLIEYKAKLRHGLGQSLWAEFDRLTPIDFADQMRFSRVVFDALSQQSALSLTPQWLISAWEESVEKSMPPSAKYCWLRWIENANTMSWRIGPTHFDMTPGNMMLGKTMPALIDLSRFRPDGIQAFDVMHFLIERRAKLERRSWVNIITRGITPPLESDGLLGDFEATGIAPSLDSLRAYFLTRAWFDGQGEGWCPVWLQRISPLAVALAPANEGSIRI